MGSYEPALKKARPYDPSDALEDHTSSNARAGGHSYEHAAALALDDDSAVMTTPPGVEPAHYYHANGGGGSHGNGNGSSADASSNGVLVYYAELQQQFQDSSSVAGGGHGLQQEQQQQQQQQQGGDLECRRYSTSEGCPYGSQCRFKHGPSDDRDLGQQPSALGSKTKPCTKFFSTSGCPYGEGCHFLHYVPGGITALGLAPYAPAAVLASSAVHVVAPSTAAAAAAVRKVVGGVGPAAAPTAGSAAAAAAADPSVTVGGYKTRLCNRYNTPEGCRFADKCHFAHGESDLRPSKSNGGAHAPPALDLSGASGIYSNGLPSYNPVSTSVYYGEPTPPGVSATCCFGATSTTKMSIEAVFAGAIIGKAGSNVKQISRLTGAKLSIRDHECDPNMRNVEMEGSLEQIDKAREMVRQFLQNREVQPARPASLGSHNFKTKLCENFVQGTCTFADRCHFAHGAHELRATPVMR